MTRRKLAALAVLALVAGLVLSGCSSKPYTDACAIIVGAGSGDVRTVKNVIHPGQKVSVKGDDEAFYLPCNARNYLVPKTGPSDRSNVPTEATTGSGTNDPNEPGLPVQIYPSMYWQLNQDDKVLEQFYPFCRKYQCAGRSESGDDQNANNATEGWNDMLGENHSQVMDRAFNRAAREFGKSLWWDTSLWPQLAEKASAYFWEEMETNTGTKVHYFCGTWTPTKEDQTEGKCSPVTFKVNTIEPTDPAVATKFREGITAQQDSDNRIADLKRRELEVAAQKSLADKQASLLNIEGYRQELAYQRQLELIKACGAANLVTCGGGSTSVLVSPQAPAGP